MMKKIIFYFILLFLLSCKKEERVYFDNGKTKYINTTENNILNFRRFDSEGNLLFSGKFTNKQLVDTLYAFDKEGDFIIKIDSADSEHFYGTLISKYSTDRTSKISLLRFRKGQDIDSIIGSSLLFGKEVVYFPNGKKSRETYYKIEGNTSKAINEIKYDSINK